MGIKLLISRIDDLNQYNDQNKVLEWKDDTPNRWKSTYNMVSIGNYAMFIGKGKVYIGEIAKITFGSKITVKDVEEFNIGNDQILQLNEIYPEYISRCKANFHPFIHPFNINVIKLKKDIINKNFISYYIISGIDIFFDGKFAFKDNDRIVEIKNGLIENIYLKKTNDLIEFNHNDNFNIIGLSLYDLLKINQNYKSENSNNVRRIKTIINELDIKGIYKFNSFFAYHDALFNARAYGNLETVSESEDYLIKNEVMKKNIALNQILYGPPGTGKTYKTINKAISIIENIDESLLEKIKRDELKKKFDSYLINDWEDSKGQIAFITFHQSMSYEDFIEGIKPIVNNNKNVSYDIIPGIFRKITSLANDNWLDAQKNSGLLSFDEAYNLLKEDWEENQEMKFPMKTKNKDFTILGFTDSSIQFKKASGGTGHTLSKNTLRKYYYGTEEVGQTGVGIYYPPILDKLKKYKPISESKIVKKIVKPFVLIIDEINRGNVSQIFGELITLIEVSKRLGKDEALEVILPYSKEKFGVPPNLYIIGTMNTADRSVEALDTALRRRFSFVEMMPNEDVFDEMTFTDSYARKDIMLKINQRIEALLDRNYTLGHSYFIKDDFKNSFENEIIPLLQEYFYNDYGKIGLVLGKGFVQEKMINDSKITTSIFADFDTKNEVDVNKSYELIPFTEINFDEAIQILLA